MAKKKTQKRARAAALTPLSALELEVMGIVWDLGECTSAEVTAAFLQRRTLAPTTIRTVLSKLRSKGYVEPIPSIGRGFLLRPTLEREAVARRSLRELLTSLFKDSPRQAIAYLLDEASITDSDLEEIRRMVNSKRKGGS